MQKTPWHILASHFLVYAEHSVARRRHGDSDRTVKEVGQEIGVAGEHRRRRRGREMASPVPVVQLPHRREVGAPEPDYG